MIQSVEPTIGEHVAALLPRMARRGTRSLPVWPPDAFAICLSLLQKGAAYCTVLGNWPPPNDSNTGEWAERIQQIGYDWRRLWVDQKKVPRALFLCWKEVLRYFDQP